MGKDFQRRKHHMEDDYSKRKFRPIKGKIQRDDEEDTRWNWREALNVDRDEE